jgi:hypothetical protein
MQASGATMFERLLGSSFGVSRPRPSRRAARHCNLLILEAIPAMFMRVVRP